MKRAGRQRVPSREAKKRRADARHHSDPIASRAARGSARALSCGCAALFSAFGRSPRRQRVATSDTYASPQSSEDYRTCSEKPRWHAPCPPTSAPAKQGGGTPPTMFCAAARPDAGSRGVRKTRRPIGRRCFSSPSAASPAQWRKLRLLQRGGGVRSGGAAPDVGGQISVRRKDLPPPRAPFASTNRAYGLS